MGGGVVVVVVFVVWGRRRDGARNVRVHSVRKAIMTDRSSCAKVVRNNLGSVPFRP